MGLGDLERRWRRRERWLGGLFRQLLAGPKSGGYRWLTVAWVLAVAARLTLVESLQASWRLPSLALVLGAAGLLIWGGRLFWLLSAVGLAVPLFFLRDWLTQTVIMLLIAVVGVATSRRPEGDSRAEQARAAGPVLVAARWLVVLTYVVAAFHKLNGGFFEPAVSCANELVVQLAEIFPGLSGVEAAALGFLPATAIVVELALPALLVARARLGIVVGLAFHIPLTLAFAPAFVFVMLIGYSAWLDESDRAAMAGVLRGGWVWLLGFGVAATTGTVVMMDELPAIDGVLKLLFLVSLLGLAVVLLVREGAGGKPARRPMSVWHRGAVAAAIAVFVANAATPYLGTQFQHAGAMLSNLRVDAGCWNHFLVPESVRAVDAYVRVDRARVGVPEVDGGEGFAEVEALLESRLWSTAALRQMRRNWCSERSRPIALDGTFLGEPLRVVDLCAPDAVLPVGPGVWGGRELFPGYLRLQKGLTRACPQACLH